MSDKVKKYEEAMRKKKEGREEDSYGTGLLKQLANLVLPSASAGETSEQRAYIRDLGQRERLGQDIDYLKEGKAYEAAGRTKNGSMHKWKAMKKSQKDQFRKARKTYDKKSRDDSFFGKLKKAFSE